MTESKREAAMCDDLARMMHYDVVKLEQRRSSRQHIGTPDRQYVGKATIWFEMKFGRDKLSVEQHRFLRRQLESVNGIASCGGMVELTALLGALQRPSLVHARNLCADQIDQWVKRGFRGQRSKAAA